MQLTMGVSGSIQNMELEGVPSTPFEGEKARFEEPAGLDWPEQKWMLSLERDSQCEQLLLLLYLSWCPMSHLSRE